MSNIVPDPTKTPLQARAQLATAHRREFDASAEDLRILRGDLACANIDAKIRRYSKDAELSGPHVAHLVGLLLANAHVDGNTVRLIEGLARDAVEAAQR